jgi:HSP20 family molecular chaperone IbpA
MAIRNPNSWMWAEASELLAQAQRLQRQFFRFGQVVESQPRWEPPVDIVASAADIQVSVALPGVAPERVLVRIAQGVLRIEAVRDVPMNKQTTRIHRLEIPYGRFERQIALPAGQYELLEQAFVNGCLILRLARVEPKRWPHVTIDR